MFDTIALSILGLSILYSVWKGMVREAFSLIALVAAYLTASHFYQEFAGWMADWIPGEALSLILSFIILFLATLLGLAMIGRLVRNFMQSGDTISGWDRILGGLFGMAKGLLLLVVFMIPLQWFDETYARLTEDSVVAPYLENWAEDLRENVGPAFSRSVPGALKGLRKQASGQEDFRDRVTDQKERLEEKLTVLSDNGLPPMDQYTDQDRMELDSILKSIEEDYNNQKK